jgi:hypothetical protein
MENPISIKEQFLALGAAQSGLLKAFSQRHKPDIAIAQAAASQRLEDAKAKLARLERERALILKRYDNDISALKSQMDDLSTLALRTNEMKNMAEQTVKPAATNKNIPEVHIVNDKKNIGKKGK